MQLTKRGRGLVIGIMLAVTGVTGTTLMQAAQHEECQVVRWGDSEIGQGTWDLLMEKGWAGDPTDSMEALHSPACFDN